MEDKLIVAGCRYDILYSTSCHDYKLFNKRKLAWYIVSEEAGFGDITVSYSSFLFNCQAS